MERAERQTRGLGAFRFFEVFFRPLLNLLDQFFHPRLQRRMLPFQAIAGKQAAHEGEAAPSLPAALRHESAGSAQAQNDPALVADEGIGSVLKIAIGTDHSITALSEINDTVAKLLRSPCQPGPLVRKLIGAGIAFAQDMSQRDAAGK